MAKKPTTVTSWRELSEAINSASQKCGQGFCEPVGTIEIRKVGAGIIKMIMAIDLIPGGPVHVDDNVPITDEDIPF